MSDFKISSLQMTAFRGQTGTEHLLALEYLHLTLVGRDGSQGIVPQTLHLELSLHLEHSDPLLEHFIPAGRWYFSQRQGLLTNLGMEIGFLSLNRMNAVLWIIVIINKIGAFRIY